MLIIPITVIQSCADATALNYALITANSDFSVQPHQNDHAGSTIRLKYSITCSAIPHHHTVKVLSLGPESLTRHKDDVTDHYY